MTRQAKHRSKAPALRKLRKTLQTLEDTAAQKSFFEAKEYVCSVCDLPVKPCSTDSRATCFHMMREGTELQALVLNARERNRQCLSCGKTISKKALASHPESEMCPTCKKKTSRTRSAHLLKGSTT